MKQGHTFDEINITPLTDVFLVLLIIMMVVAPMMVQTRADVEPPDITAGQKVDQTKLIVEVTAAGEFYVQGQPTSADGLKSALEANIDLVKDKNVVIRADKNTKSKDVMKIFEAARDAKFEKVTIAGKPLENNRQNALKSGQTTTPPEETQ